MSERETIPPPADSELKFDAMQSILTINGGSSSIKFALYQASEPLKRRLYGKIDRIGLSDTNLEFLGIELEEKRNAANEGVISAPAGRVAARVIHTDEERTIAESVCCVLGLGTACEKRNSDHSTK